MHREHDLDGAETIARAEVAIESDANHFAGQSAEDGGGDLPALFDRTLQKLQVAAKVRFVGKQWPPVPRRGRGRVRGTIGCAGFAVWVRSHGELVQRSRWASMKRLTDLPCAVTVVRPGSVAASNQRPTRPLLRR